MWYKIKQGRHRAYPLSLGIHTGKTSETYEVIFDDSCRYTLEGTDKEDWNKLVGWSYGILPKGIEQNNYITHYIPAHHNNSIRIGWRYNPKIDRIEITNYGYLDSERIVEQDGIQEVEFNKKTILTIDCSDSDFNTSKWGYNLGLYFGGRNDKTGKDNVAPHDMKVWIKKLKSC